MATSPPGSTFTTRLTRQFMGFFVLGLLVMVVFANTTASSKLAIVGLGLILVLAFLLARQLARRTLNPVDDLRTRVQDLARRHQLQETPSLSDDDLVQIGRTVDALALQFQDRLGALERERAQVSAILNSMVEGVIACDAQERIVMVNPSAREILHVTEPTVEGKLLLEVVRNRALADLIAASRQSGNPSRRQEIQLAGPHPRMLEVNLSPLPLAGDSQGFVLVLHDVTEIRRLEHVRSEFMANVSHELRTPLTAITGYLETLLHEAPADPATSHQFLKVAHTHAERLGRLLDDLHRLSNIETGKVHLRLEHVRLDDLFQEVSAMFEREASRKGVTLVNTVEADVSAVADRDRLSQILVNLLDNAVKFTPSGGHVRMAAQPRSKNEVTIRIEDTGQGIPPPDVPRVTERFYRVDKARSREEGGTGLGLAIVKHLVHLHGGTLHIESELGKGTAVSVTVPASPTSVDKHRSEIGSA